jgi:hypothetical protein
MPEGGSADVRALQKSRLSSRAVGGSDGASEKKAAISFNFVSSGLPGRRA